MGALLVRHEPTSAAVVRRRLSADLERQGVDPRQIDEAILVASELVGNAVRHTCTSGDDLDVQWAVEGDEVLLTVADPSTEIPRPRTSDPGETNGRGLAIVSALTSDWGVRCTGHGKQVWARVPLH